MPHSPPKKWAPPDRRDGASGGAQWRIRISPARRTGSGGRPGSKLESRKTGLAPGVAAQVAEDLLLVVRRRIEQVLAFDRQLEIFG